MSDAVLFLAAGLGSSVVLGLLVFFFSRPRVPKNGYGQYSAQRNALSNATQHRYPDDKYGSRGVTLLESSKDAQDRAPEQGRSATGT
jgi:hypothetical protein